MIEIIIALVVMLFVSVSIYGLDMKIKQLRRLVGDLDRLMWDNVGKLENKVSIAHDNSNYALSRLRIQSNHLANLVTEFVKQKEELEGLRSVVVVSEIGRMKKECKCKGKGKK